MCHLRVCFLGVSPFGGAFHLEICFHWVCGGVCCLQASYRSPIIEQRKKLLFIPADFCTFVPFNLTRVFVKGCLYVGSFPLIGS